MNELHDAYRYLDLPIGSPYDPVVQRQYAKLIAVWRPGRASDDPQWKKKAVEKLKKINNYYEIIRRHFESGHKDGDQSCACQSQAEEQVQSTHRPTGSGTERRRRTTEEHQKASEEAAKKARQAATEEALKQEVERETDQIKWRIARASGIAFVILFVVSWFGMEIKGSIYSPQRTKRGEQSSSNSSTNSVNGSPGAPPSVSPRFEKNQSEEDQGAIGKAEEPGQAEQEQIDRQDPASNLRNDINKYQWKLDRLKRQINNIEAEMAEETAKAEDSKARMSDIERSLGVNFTYSAADRRGYPLEYSKWQAFATMANEACKNLDVMQVQKDNMVQDWQNCQTKINQAQDELSRLQSL